ncbi:MAG: hypothetical protein IJZ26_03285 [Clostridia bacterium]|nr:hypothetical protein [Clostridia bacterium]
MEVGKHILRIFIVLVLIAGIVTAVLLLTKPNNNVSSSYYKYQELVTSEGYETLTSKVSHDDNNALKIFGNNIDNNYKYATSFYNAEMFLFETLATDLYFVSGNGEYESEINKQIENFKKDLSEINRSIKLFETNREEFGVKGEDPTTDEGKELIKQFKHIEECVVTQAKHLANINSVLFQYVKSSLFNNDIYASLKYTMIENIYNQAYLVYLSWDNLLTESSTVQEAEQKSTNRRILQEDTDLMFNKYLTESRTNFVSVSVENGASLQFVDAYKKMDKEAFYENINKTEYYQSLSTANQQVIDPIYNFFGFNKGGAI